MTNILSKVPLALEFPKVPGLLGTSDMLDRMYSRPDYQKYLKDTYKDGYIPYKALHGVSQPILPPTLRNMSPSLPKASSLSIDPEAMKRSSLRFQSQIRRNEADERRRNMLGAIGKIGGGLANNAGNLLSMYATYQGARDQERLIRENRATDTANINPYKDFGQRGLAQFDASMARMGQARDIANNELLRQQDLMNANIGANALSSGQARANMLQGYAQSLDASNKQDMAYNQMLQAQMGQRAQMLNQMDQMVMQGEGARDQADRQDKDNYYNNLGAALQTRTGAMQTLARDMNTMRQEQVLARLRANLSQYGFTIDDNGNLVKGG